MRINELKVTKCYKDDIFLVIAFYLSLFNFVTIPFINTIRNILVMILLMYVFQNVKRIIRCENKTIVFLVLSYSCWMVIDSLFHNEYIYLANVNSLVNSLIKALIVVESIFTVDIYCQKRGFSRLLNALVKFIGTMFIVSNSWLLFSGFKKTIGDYYLIGTKFSTSYINLLFISLLFFKNYYYKKKIDYIGIVLLFIFSFYIIIGVGCYTAIIALILLILFLLFKLHLQKLFSGRLLFLVLYAAVFLFVYFYNIVLENEYVAHVIVNILKKTLTMTGRANIFRILPELLSDKLLTGFGSGRTGMILNFYTGCNDAQNGVWQIICENGLIGFILYALTSLKLHTSGDKEKITTSYYVNMYFVVMLILGFVEITYDTRLLVLLFIIYLYNTISQGAHEPNDEMMNI